MPEKTPPDRGRLLVDALIVWITLDRSPRRGCPRAPDTDCPADSLRVPEACGQQVPVPPVRGRRPRRRRRHLPSAAAAGCRDVESNQAAGSAGGCAPSAPPNPSRLFDSTPGAGAGGSGTGWRARARTPPCGAAASPAPADRGVSLSPSSCRADDQVGDLGRMKGRAISDPGAAGDVRHHPPADRARLLTVRRRRPPPSPRGRPSRRSRFTKL